MDISVFKNNIEKYAAAYNPASLFEKIKKFSKKAGAKTIYLVLVLYYATFDKQLPVKDRIMVFAALGYFILPLDFIPDAFLGGFTDDAAALLFVAKHIWNNLSEDTFRKARKKLAEWLGETDDPGLRI